MKTYIQLFGLFLYSIALAGCKETEVEIIEVEKVNQMQWLYTADPSKDFTNSIKNKDFRFIGVNGYSLVVPRMDLNCLNIEKDVRAITGTSDMIVGYEHAKLIAIAKIYADYYNLQMKEYLERNSKLTCNN